MTASVRPDGNNLTDQVIRYVIDHIRGRGLGPGEQVPSEIRTSASLRVSRGVVREAYRSLSNAGILEISNGRTPRVGQLNNKAFLQIVEHGLTTQQATVEHILDLRSSVEIRAAELAAMNRTPEHIRALEKILAVFDSINLNDQREVWVEADLSFHLLIGEASGNPLFRLLSDALLHALELSIRRGLDRRILPEQISRMIETHKRIARAIVAGDSETARKQMIAHFDEACSDILSPLPV